MPLFKLYSFSEYFISSPVFKGSSKNRPKRFAGYYSHIKNNILILALAIFCLIGLFLICPVSAAITANFNSNPISPTSGVAPLGVSFSDASTGGPTSWAWYFGDENWTVIGSNWTEVNSSSGWPARLQGSAVALPNGHILEMAGSNNGASVKFNDTWVSADEGQHWSPMNQAAPWMARYAMGAAALSNGAVVIFGGVNDTGDSDDTWISTDEGNSWSQVITSLAPPKRDDFGVVTT